jgi:predicted phage terminase large subunit-like protein
MGNQPSPAQAAKLAIQTMTRGQFSKALARHPRRSERARLMWFWRCETDRELFARVAFPDYCSRPFNRMHSDRFQVTKEPCTKERRGTKRAKAAPRGNAKSTLDGFIDLVHDIVYGLEPFIIVISDTAALSTERVKDIKSELETNEFLRWVYGDLVPRGDGAKWTETDLVASNGVRVLASSMLKSIRGKKSGPWRPTKVILDDAEDSDNVRSPLQRSKAESFLAKDILKAGAAYTTFEFIGTLLHADSLLAKALRGDRGVGGWSPSLYRAVEAWPERMDLWGEFEAIALDISKPTHDADARDFYEANREAMDAGARVLWPEHEPLVDLMLMRAYDGVASFNSEKQNEPYDPGTQLWDYKGAGFFTIETAKDGAQWIACDDGLRVELAKCTLFAALDPAMAKRAGSDTAAIVTVAKYEPGGKAPLFFVLDAWVDRKPPSAQIEALYAAYDKWGHDKMGLEVNGFQQLLRGDIERIARERLAAGVKNWRLPIYGFEQTTEKLARVSKLEPKITHKWIRFNKALPPLFADQMTQFPTHTNDDGPDACEAALALAGLRKLAAEAITISLFG